MAYQLPTGFSFVGTKPAAAPGATTNQYGFAAGSLNFQPASDFVKAPAAAPAAPVTPIAAMPVEYTMPIQQTPAPAPVVTPPPPPVVNIANPVIGPSPDLFAEDAYFREQYNGSNYNQVRAGWNALTPQQKSAYYPSPVQAPEVDRFATQAPPPPPVATTPPVRTLPPGFSFKTPAAPAPAPVVTPPPPPPPVVQPPVQTPPPPVVQPPVQTPPPAPVVKPPVAGPVTPPTVKAPVVTQPKPAPVDPRVAALKNQGYTDAQIAAAGGAAALLAKVNAPKTAPGAAAPKTTAAVNYTAPDMAKAITALQKANPNFSVQGIPISKWSTAGVTALAKTDPAVFNALSGYLPKY